ncbi:hypothetical protein [Hymenobacter coccineus]|uniref:hypothetical protein n=1 Tax=Hymenobacter coccineus TaxID=1908235 RepID=UPI000A7C8850|nr:hypothetical protein [Hymenobacter coccineus]
MKVSSTEPFQIVYSLFEHEFLGHLFAAYLVQRGPKGQLTLLHQTASARNAPEFASGLDAIDFELIELCDQLQQEAVIKEFWPRKIAPADFFLKTYSSDKGDKPLQDAVARHVQTRMAAVLARLHGKQVFIMGRDGEPTWREIALAPVPASVLFHFRRNDDGTHYFPTIQYQNQKLDFQYKGALLVCQQPAWLLLDGIIYSFHNDVDGRKLQPFLNKKFIVVPRQVEASYFQKFVAPLMEAFDVHARGVGFAVVTDRYRARPRLTFSDVPPAGALPEAPERPPGPPRRGRVPQPKPAAAPQYRPPVLPARLPLRRCFSALRPWQARERAPGADRRQLHLPPPAAQHRRRTGRRGRAGRPRPGAARGPRGARSGGGLPVAARQCGGAGGRGLCRGAGRRGQPALFPGARARRAGHSGSGRLV